MPLQIRRGTDAERLAMTQPLASGELLYVTDTQRLYIGNNSTLGGIAVTGYTDNDAKDAAAAIFTGGTHTAINFSYNTLTNIMNVNVDLSNYQGVITADGFSGSVFADDSTLLVDAVSGVISAPVIGNVTGNLTGNVLGDLTGNTTGYHTGDVKGSVFAQDSSLLVDAVNGTLTGSFYGSVFTNNIDSSDSSAINVDPLVIFKSDIQVENEIIGDLVGDITGNVKNSTGNTILDSTSKTANLSILNLDAGGLIGSPAGIFILPTTQLQVLVDGGDIGFPKFLYQTNENNTIYTSAFGLFRGRGTGASPLPVQANDEIAKLVGYGYDGANYMPTAGIVYLVDGPVSPFVVPSRLELAVTAASGTFLTPVVVKSDVVNFSVPPKLPVVANDAARTTLVPSPTKGMMIFMESGTTPAATNVAQVFDGTNWINL